ncbi:hypothetical protein [Flavobacterium granuli]|nr:hypothetical protein [Flavobacterium granuli]
MHLIFRPEIRFEFIKDGLSIKNVVLKIVELDEFSEKHQKIINGDL